MGSGVFVRSEAWGQNAESGTVEEYGDKASKAAGAAKGLSGAAVVADSGDEGISVPDVSLRPESPKIPKLQPIKGFQQLAGSKDVKELYKGLITQPVPVMFQTMMMVENGAATGFIGSMNAVSNLFSNTVESQEFQLKLFEAKLSDNIHKQGYVASVVEAMQEKNKDNWPAALWYASGDKVKDNNITEQNYQPNQSESGSSALDVAKADGVKGDQEPLLSKVLFPSDPDFVGPPSQEMRDENALKEEIIDRIGDVKIKAATPENGVQTGPTVEFQPPKKEKEITRGGEKITLTGYEAFVAEKREEVWKSLNAYMGEFCSIKTKSGSLRYGEPFNGRIGSVHQEAQKNKQSDWAKLRGEDIQLTENFIDQFFTVLLDDAAGVEGDPLAQLKEDCQELFQQNSKLPDEKKISDITSITRYNDCKGGKPCVPRLVMFAVTKAIAESKAIREYYRLAYVFFARAMSQEGSKLWIGMANQVMCRSLKKELGGVDCSVMGELEQRRLNNRLVFNEFIDRFSTFAAGKGGASIFRPVTNNVPNTQ
jgi:hypothetical protein